MPFLIPDTAKELSKTTVKIYKSRLNKLADVFDIDTIEKIVANPKPVVAAIHSLTDEIEDMESRKAERRMYFSAVFYVLHNQPILKVPDNPLRVAFAKNNPTLKEGNWKPQFNPDTPQKK